VPKKKAKRQIPRFRSEEAERRFWAEEDSSDYVNWSEARRPALPDLRPSTRTISLRLPEALLEDLKLLANKRDVPYQSLLKIYLAERIQEEFGRLKKTG
jgi:predicted DNA binding CopG/RHH family protein